MKKFFSVSVMFLIIFLLVGCTDKRYELVCNAEIKDITNKSNDLYILKVEYSNQNNVNFYIRDRSINDLLVTGNKINFYYNKYNKYINSFDYYNDKKECKL